MVSSLSIKCLFISLLFLLVILPSINYNQAQGDKFQQAWKIFGPVCKEIAQAFGSGVTKEGLNQIGNWLNPDDSGKPAPREDNQKNGKFKSQTQNTCETCQCTP